jgi:hypothetical protein
MRCTAGLAQIDDGEARQGSSGPLQLLVGTAESLGDGVEHCVVTSMQVAFGCIDRRRHRARSEAQMPVVMLRRCRRTKYAEALPHRVPARQKEREHRMVLRTAKPYGRQKQEAGKLPARLPDLIESRASGEDIAERQLVQPRGQIARLTGRNGFAPSRTGQGRTVLDPPHPAELPVVRQCCDPRSAARADPPAPCARRSFRSRRGANNTRPPLRSLRHPPPDRCRS